MNISYHRIPFGNHAVYSVVALWSFTYKILDRIRKIINLKPIIILPETFTILVELYSKLYSKIEYIRFDGLINPRIFEGLIRTILDLEARSLNPLDVRHSPISDQSIIDNTKFYKDTDSVASRKYIWNNYFLNCITRGLAFLIKLNYVNLLQFSQRLNPRNFVGNPTFKTNLYLM